MHFRVKAVCSSLAKLCLQLCDSGEAHECFCGENVTQHVLCSAGSWRKLWVSEMEVKYHQQAGDSSLGHSCPLVQVPVGSRMADAPVHARGSRDAVESHGDE